ncbi:MAG: hypothetical protein AAF735_01825 [Myxococcota bacterium]
MVSLQTRSAGSSSKLLFIVALHIRRQNRALARAVPHESEQATTLDVDLELYTRLKDWLAKHNGLRDTESL